MKKITYNILAFILIPFIIVITGIILSFIVHYTIWLNEIDYGSITEKSLKTELWQIVEVSDVETAYIVYGLDDCNIADDEYVIVIQGSSVEDIAQRVGNCYPGAFRDSYIKDAEDYRIIDMTSFKEIREYIGTEETNSYSANTDENVEEYIGNITEKLENARLYDISDYIGYDESYNNGKALADAFAILVIVIVFASALVIELVLALIIKILINKNLK